MTNAEAIQTLKLMQAQVEWEYPMNYAAAIDEAIKALEVQEWIPCRERLPERGKDVLVTRDYDGREDNNKSCRYVEVASCYGEDDDITWSSFSDEYKMKPRNHHVVAWRPLPEPYREDKPWSAC